MNKNKKPTNHPSDLQSHIGFWLRMVSNHISYSFANKLKIADVTVAEWVILREMFSSNQTTSPSHIAELTGLTRGAVSKLVERLMNKGLIIRSAALEDRRYQDISLTKRAVKIVPDLALLADQNDEEFFSALSATERAQLKLLLKKIVNKKQFKQIPID